MSARVWLFVCVYVQYSLHLRSMEAGTPWLWFQEMGSDGSWPITCVNSSGGNSHIRHTHPMLDSQPLNDTEGGSVFVTTFCCMPVDFEVVNVDSSVTSEDDISNAIMAIRRNGVALKGIYISLSQCILPSIRKKVHSSCYKTCPCTQATTRTPGQ